jgi:hypothetical protein
MVVEIVLRETYLLKRKNRPKYICKRMASESMIGRQSLERFTNIEIQNQEILSFSYGKQSLAACCFYSRLF